MVSLLLFDLALEIHRNKIRHPMHPEHPESSTPPSHMDLPLFPNLFHAAAPMGPCPRTMIASASGPRSNAHLFPASLSSLPPPQSFPFHTPRVQLYQRQALAAVHYGTLSRARLPFA